MIPASHWTVEGAIRVVRIRNGEHVPGHFEHLMSVPAVRQGRIKLRDAVPYSDKTLARLSKPFTTATYIKAQKIAPYTKLPKYRDWLKSIGAWTPKPRKRKSAPMFCESAPEAWRDLPADYERIAS